MENIWGTLARELAANRTVRRDDEITVITAPGQTRASASSGTRSGHGPGGPAPTIGVQLRKSNLYGLRALDPLAVAASAAILGVVALIAGYIPQHAQRG